MIFIIEALNETFLCLPLSKYFHLLLAKKKSTQRSDKVISLWFCNKENLRVTTNLLSSSSLPLLVSHRLLMCQAISSGQITSKKEIINRKINEPSQRSVKEMQKHFRSSKNQMQVQSNPDNCKASGPDQKLQLTGFCNYPGHTFNQISREKREYIAIIRVNIDL